VNGSGKIDAMKPSISKLQKFLQLEADRGYDNRAVMGGLDRMLAPWEAEARAEAVSEDFIQAVVARLRDYSRLSENSRAEALEGLWRRIQREGNVSLPPLSQFEKRPEDASPSVQKRVPKSSPSQPQKRAAPELGGDEEQALSAEAAQENGAPTAKMQTRTAPAPVRAPRTQAPPGPPAALDASVTVLPGVGPSHAQTLARLGLSNLQDMLYYFPRRYDDYTQLKPINRLFYGEEVTVIAMVKSVTVRPVRGGSAKIIEAVVSDGTGALRITWFNQVWIAQKLRADIPVVLSGKIDQYLGRLVMNNPEWEPVEQQNLHTNRIVPVYPLTANITQRWLRRLMHQVVSYWAPRVLDYLPERVLDETGMVDLPRALQDVHFPASAGDLKAARQRLAFDEIFLLQLGVLQQKISWQSRSARVFAPPQEWLEQQLERLPFSLTGAQQKALADILSDLASGSPMNRLLQGDVGSGKTVLAALAGAVLVREGAQAALMAPTSILGEQHYRSLLRLLASGEEPSALKPDEIRLMIGATPEGEKREIRDGLASGAIKVIVGTHALIEEPVSFANLQLVVVDEQHRFGVNQRAMLRSKGENPHLLVMTATPIPRSLALTVYGDLDLTVMDEMPPGRQAIDTFVLVPRERERAYSLIKSNLEKGQQAFIIYPLVEDNEEGDTLAAVNESERLQKEVFFGYQVGLLHGRMKPEEKDEVMRRFRDGELHVLVSTSVVEVGVDVPNATVMLIEGANRFGLAQLHQFRGRVGRGSEKSYCLLIPDNADAAENERLQAMVETNDGFVLAERDLEQRGPGDFLGSRQSGFGLEGKLRMASLTDVHLIENARRQAQAIFAEDPGLENEENQKLASTLQRYWRGQLNNGKGDIS
jgi:ATP-dependent DNA helicase RecG